MYLRTRHEGAVRFSRLAPGLSFSLATLLTAAISAFGLLIGIPCHCKERPPLSIVVVQSASPVQVPVSTSPAGGAAWNLSVEVSAPKGFSNVSVAAWEIIPGPSYAPRPPLETIWREYPLSAGPVPLVAATASSDGGRVIVAARATGPDGRLASSAVEVCVARPDGADTTPLPSPGTATVGALSVSEPSTVGQTVSAPSELPGRIITRPDGSRLRVLPSAASALQRTPPAPGNHKRPPRDGGAGMGKGIFASPMSEQEAQLLSVSPVKPWEEAGPVASGKGTVTAGTVKILAIPVRFTDTAFSTDLATFSTRLDEVRNYFQAVSGNTLNLSFTLANSGGGAFQTGKTMATYGANSGATIDPNIASLVTDSLNLVDPTYDFSTFDSVMIFHAGAGEEAVGAPDNCIWSVHVNLGTPHSADGVFVHAAMIMPETYQPYSSDSTLGVICHEYGHELGLPDLYDTDDGDGSDTEGIGEWGLMGSGGWLGSGASPAEFCAWSKKHLGWITVEDVAAPASAITLNQVETGRKALRVWINRDSGEYFLVENRQRTGRDTQIPGQGILIWHVDESLATRSNWSQNNVLNADGPHKMVDLEEADGMDNLDHKDNRGDPGDAWSSGMTFNAASAPSSDGYGGASGITLSGFSVSGSSMTFDAAIPFEIAGTTPGADYIDLLLTGTPAIPQSQDTGFYSLSGTGNPTAVTQVGDRTLRLTFGSAIDRTKVLNLTVSGPTDSGGNPLFHDPLTIVNAAGTNIGGYISSATVLDSSGSPYFVNRDLIVVQAAMLNISQGARLLFKKETQADTYPSDRVDLLVYGKLSVTGTKAEPVVFESAEAVPAAGDWGGVFLSGRSDTDSSVSGIRVSHAKRGFYIQEAIVELNGSEILDFSDTGIYLDKSLRNRVTGCRVQTSLAGSRAGMKIALESETTVYGCSFTADNGVVVYNDSKPAEFFGNNLTGSNFGMIKSGTGFTQDARYNYWTGNGQNTSGLVNATQTLASKVDTYFQPATSRFMNSTYASTVSYVDPASTVYAEVSGTDWDAAAVNRLVLVARTTATDTKGIRLPLIETSTTSGVYRASFTIGASSSEASSILGAVAGETIELFWPSSGGMVLASVPVGRLPAAPILNDPGVISTDGNFSVSWSPADSADTYFLEEASNPAFTGAATYNVGAALSRDFTGKSQGTWHYRVRGSNSYGTGPWSNAESIEVAVVGIPVLSTAAPLDTDGTYSLTWTSVTGADPYEVEESPDQDFASTANIYTGLDLVATLSGRSEGVRYYRARALISGVPGGWSNVVRVAVNNQVLVTGRVRFEDRTFDATGFTGTSWTAAQGFMVEAVRVSNQSVVLASARTSADGSYSIDLTGSPHPDVAIIATCRAGVGTDSIRVYDTPASMALYGAMKDNAGAGYDLTDGADHTVDVDADIAGGIAGAFNIASVAVQCHDTLANRLGAPAPSIVDAFWVQGSGSSTYYQAGRIMVAGSAADPDEFDDTVIAHEYAHFVLVSYSRDDTPGGDHSSVEKCDVRLAWSEGFSTFFACLARNDSLYADTNAAGVFSYEIETPSPHPNRTGSDNETSVAAALWDIVDTVDEAFDGPVAVSYGAVDTPQEAIFHVVSSTMPNLADLSIEDFWHGWFNGAHNFANDGVMASIFASRKMNFAPDAAEPDSETIPAASLDTPLQRTFYPAADQDWFIFTAVPGLPLAAETYALANACDTVVTVFDDQDTQVAENDNEAVGDYRSRAVFTPATAGPFKARVKTRPETRFADYGDYEFRVGHNILGHASISGPLAIADNGRTAFEMQFAQSYAVKSVALRVRISHPAAGELSVFLRSPSGMTVEVARGLPEGLEDFSVWIPDQSPAYGDLTKFQGSGVAGTWRMTIADGSSGNAGVLKGWSLRLGIENPPAKPVLKDPGDTDSDGSYSISWYSVDGADLYELQEDDDPLFGTPTLIYSGTGLATAVSGRQTGRYGYRVRARKLGAYFGPWSDPQTIDVVLGTISITSPNFGQDFETRFASQTISGICSATAVTIEVNGSASGVVHQHGTTSWSYPATLAEGPNTFTFTAYDAQGDPGPSDTIVIILDTAAPEKPVITTNGGADIETRASTVILEGTCGTGVSAVMVNGSISGVAFIVGTTTWNFSGTLVPGVNSFVVTAYDQAGNVSQAARIAVTSDPFPPQRPSVSTNGGVSFTTSAAYATLDGWCSADTEIITVNGFTAGVTHAAGTNSWSFFTNLTLGNNDFVIVASDRVGNASPPVSITVVYSPKAVETSIQTGPSGAMTWNEVTFVFSSSETGAQYAWMLSPIETSYTAWSTANTVTYQGLTPGVYTFGVKSRAPDGTEDPSPATRIFEIVSVTAGQILVNEIFPGPGPWIEIYNTGTSDVNLTGWTVSATGTDFTFPTFTLRSRSFVVLRQDAGSGGSDSIDFGSAMPFVPGGGGYVSVTDSFGRGADFVRWGPSTQIPPDGTGFTGSSSSPAAGQSLARGPRPVDTNLASDFTPGELVSPGAPNLSGIGFLGIVRVVSEPDAISGFGTETLIDGSEEFNSDYAVNNGRFPVKITLGFGSLAEVSSITLTNDGQYGARSVRVSAVDQTGGVTPVTTRLSLPAITSAPTPTKISFGLTRCSGLILDFEAFHNRTWFQLNEIKVSGIDSPGEETALAIVSATSTMTPYPGHGPGQLYDGKSVYNDGFVAINRGSQVDITLDLGTLSTLRALEHHNDGEYGALAGSLSVSASKDGPWTRVETLSGFDATPGAIRVQTFRVPETQARFVRISYTAFSDPVWFQVAEIIPRGTSGASQNDELVPPVSVWSSPAGYPGYEAVALTDGSVEFNSDFAVLHEGEPVSITFDFGGIVTVERIETVNDGEFGASSVDIFAGDTLDREATAPVGSFNGLSNSAGVPTQDTVSIDPLQCRYMRLVYSGFVNSRWLQLNEVRFRGAGLAEQPGKAQISSVVSSVASWPGYGPEKLADGTEEFNSDFAVLHNNAPVEVVLELPEDFQVTALRHVNDGPYGALSLIVSTAPSSTPDDYTLAGSFDGLGYSQSSPVPDLLTLGRTVTARRIKIRYVAYRHGKYLQVNEIEVLGSALPSGAALSQAVIAESHPDNEALRPDRSPGLTGSENRFQNAGSLKAQLISGGSSDPIEVSAPDPETFEVPVLLMAGKTCLNRLAGGGSEPRPALVVSLPGSMRFPPALIVTLPDARRALAVTSLESFAEYLSLCCWSEVLIAGEAPGKPNSGPRNEAGFPIEPVSLPAEGKSDRGMVGAISDAARHAKKMRGAALTAITLNDDEPALAAAARETSGPDTPFECPAAGASGFGDMRPRGVILKLVPLAPPETGRFFPADPGSGVSRSAAEEVHRAWNLAVSLADPPSWACELPFLLDGVNPPESKIPLTASFCWVVLQVLRHGAEIRGNEIDPVLLGDALREVGRGTPGKAR